MIAIDSQPFSIVEDTGFLRLLSNMCLLYAVPSRKYFAEKVIPEMFSNIKVQLMKDIYSDGDSFLISLQQICGLGMLEETHLSAGQLTTLTPLPSHEKSVSFKYAPLLGRTQHLLYQK